MPLLDWKDSYSVGVAAVDHEHRELIDLINTLHEELTASGGGREVLAIFGDIYKGISSHFALEEKFMREHDYDQLADHKSDHERLLDELRDIMDDYEDGGDVGEADSALLSERLGAWFARHFGTHDARLHSRLGTHPHD
jgi:hemerythrin